jgi:hypothetical protein
MSDRWLTERREDAGSLPAIFTAFADQAATEKFDFRDTLNGLAELMAKPLEPDKSRLPWLVLGRFGDKPTGKRCLRHKENLLAITGVECDYDGKIDDGKTTFEEAVNRLRRTGIEAVAYTSPSHNAEAPRWRVLCPFASDYPPTERDRFLDRLNGVLGGVLEPESWTLSRAYYFGSVEGKPRVRVEVVRGRRLDLRDDLDAGAIGKGGVDKTIRLEKRSAPEGLIECDDDPRLIAEAERRIERATAHAEGATETGNRTFSLAAWLADMRTRDGLILSKEAIVDLLMEHWPAACHSDIIEQTVANALKHRGNDRGCEPVVSPTERLAGLGLDWDKPVKSPLRPLSSATIYDKLNESIGDCRDLGTALIRQIRGRGYTPNQVLQAFAQYAASRIGDYYKGGGADLRSDIAQVFSEPIKVPVTIHIPDRMIGNIITNALENWS